MVFCPECGKENSDEDKFCKSCGKNLEDSENNSKDKKELDKNQQTSKNNENLNSDNKTLLLPLLLGVIGVFIGIIEGLNCPAILGWENIVCEMTSAILGGCLGIFLYRFKKEYFIAGIQFILTGILMMFFLYAISSK